MGQLLPPPGHEGSSHWPSLRRAPSQGCTRAPFSRGQDLVGVRMTSYLINPELD